MSKLGIALLLAAVLACGAAGPARADSTTPLPITLGEHGAVWMTVDPAAGHVFVTAGPGSSTRTRFSQRPHLWR